MKIIVYGKNMKVKLNRFSLLSLSFLGVIFSLDCQAFDCKNDSNCIDFNGWRQGYWYTCHQGLCYESYYLNDTLNGIHKTYYQNGKISSIGVYQKGK
jgi:hypothetical protein